MATTPDPKAGAPAEEPKAKAPVTEEDKINANSVLAGITELLKETDFTIPVNYNVDSAVRLALLDLQDLEVEVGNQKVLALTHCTPKSIKEALFKMIIQGLNPMKKQVYFIARGNKLYMDRSYQGEVAVARRVAGVKKVNARVIREGDDYLTES